MRHRVHCLMFSLVVGFPLLASGQEKGPRPTEPSEARDIATMGQMRSLVLPLIELGWNDFFLNAQLLNSLDENAPSPDQVRKLVSLRGAFREEREWARGRIMEASLALYQELNGDQVSAYQIESRLNTLFALESKLVGLRIQYLLRAINVLDHAQHQKLAAFPVPAFNPLIRPQSPVPPVIPRIAPPFANKRVQ